MGLVTIVDEDGKEHLIHTSQIGPRYVPRPPPPDPWPDVWERFDLEERPGEPTPPA